MGSKELIAINTWEGKYFYSCGGNPMDRPKYVGVIGAGECSDLIYQMARNLGIEIGKKGWILVCGGLGGVMEGAARGCTEAGGITVGILPGLEKNSANPYIKIALPTGLGEGRNLLVARASDVLVSIAGGYGTLSEIALALKINKPVVGLETWENIQGIRYVSDPREAIQKISELK
jgi:uncharacterized protein (TIGR00725 family)